MPRVRVLARGGGADPRSLGFWGVEWAQCDACLQRRLHSGTELRRDGWMGAERFRLEEETKRGLVAAGEDGGFGRLGNGEWKGKRRCFVDFPAKSILSRYWSLVGRVAR